MREYGDKSGSPGNPGYQRAGGKCGNIVRGVANAREQVRQVTVAVKEQAKQGQNIITAVENVTNQAAQVTQATKEQTKVLRK